MVRHTYELDEMAQFLSKIDAAIEEIRDQLAGAKATTAMIKNGYDGASSDAFQTSYEDWHAKAEEHVRRLESFRSLVHVAHTNYAEAERTNTAMFGRA